MEEEQGLATTGAGKETRKVAGAITSMGIDELIFNMAKGIADGQARLDETCMQLAIQMGDAQIEFGKIPGTNDPDFISLVELGFTPNFYQFVDTILEIRVSVSSQYEEEQETSTSEINQQQNESAAQQEYASNRDNRYSGYNYGYGGGWAAGWSRGWAGAHWGGSGHGSNYSGGSSASAKQNSFEKSKSVKVNTVDASFSSKYAYSVEASSLIKTKIVPVPPPQVFEEIVQSKAKERKEWARRFALLRFSKNLLPAISDSGIETRDFLKGFVSLDEDENGGSNQAASSPAFQDAGKIIIGLQSLSEEYAKLTNDHWSVIENVKDRRMLDTLLKRLLDSGSQIPNYYDNEENATTDNEKEEEFHALLRQSFDSLSDLKSKIDEIMERLPLTPEEMAEQETEQEPSN